METPSNALESGRFYVACALQFFCFMILRILALAIALTACTTFRQARPDLPADERGVAELTTLLELFKVRARTHQFEVAYRILDELESGVDDATTYTRSHPDFDDLVSVVERARPALDELAERERRRLRAVAIAALTERLHAVLARSTTLVAALPTHMPNAAEVNALDDIVDDLEDVEDDGEEYLDEASWSETLSGARPAIANLQRKLVQAEWVRDLADDLERPLRTALATEGTASPAQSIRRYQVAVVELERCANRIEAQRCEPGYNNDIPLETGLGRLSAEETAFTCRLRMAKAQQRLDGARWRQLVEQAIDHVEEARHQLAARGSASIQLDGVRRAIAALESCRASLVGTERHAGFDAGVSFATPLGRLGGAAIRAACREEVDALEPRVASLVWLVSLEGTASRAAEAHSHAMTAARDRRRAAELLSLAAGGFAECIERSLHLGRSPARDSSARVDSPFGRVNGRELARLCGVRHGRVKKRLERVRRRHVASIAVRQ